MLVWAAHTERLRHEDYIGARLCAIFASAHAPKGKRFKTRDFMYLDASGSPKKNNRALLDKRPPTGNEILNAFRAMGVQIIDKRDKPE